MALAGLLAFAAANGLARHLGPFASPVFPAAAVLGATLAATALADAAIGKAHRNPSTGLDWARHNPDWRRAAVKYLGLLASVAAMLLCYWLFPEYHGRFYLPYYSLLTHALPPFLLLALPYVYWVDAHMREPQDGYWQTGLCLLLRWGEVDKAVLRQHLLGWLVKTFFTPLMFVYFCDYFAQAQAFRLENPVSFKAGFDLAYLLFFYAEVGFACIGYVASLRIIDTHIRSTDASLAGWVAALCCYQPFWSLFGQNYLAYESGHPWGAWLQDQPFWYALWGSAILACLGIYASATIAFGLRFSNLTHRGIITTGPYAWMKHPAYVSKNLSFWLIAIPFIAHDGPAEALRHSLLLLGLNGIYLLRALTEEKHLAQDPAYAEYAAWLGQHGLAGRLGRCLGRWRWRWRRG